MCLQIQINICRLEYIKILTISFNRFLVKINDIILSEIQRKNKWKIDKGHFIEILSSPFDQVITFLGILSVQR